MGLNAFFAFTVVIGMGIPWETALAGTFVSGVLFFLLTVSGAREAVINAIPMQLKLAVGAGIGIFIAFIGLQNAGIVVRVRAHGVTLGDLTVLRAAAGAVRRRGHRAVPAPGHARRRVLRDRGHRGRRHGRRQVPLPDGVVSAVPSVAPTFGEAFLAMPELLTAQMAMVVFTMLFVDFFDTAGTLIAVTNQAGLLDEDGRLPRANRALVSDSIATMGGAAVGTSTTTSYIESAAGVGAGGRTGLTSVTTGRCS
jgi:adenine/guanine/hypoxanthine permease